jgi:hypothetical protein
VEYFLPTNNHTLKITNPLKTQRRTRVGRTLDVVVVVVSVNYFFKCLFIPFSLQKWVKIFTQNESFMGGGEESTERQP